MIGPLGLTSMMSKSLGPVHIGPASGKSILGERGWDCRGEYVSDVCTDSV